MQMLDTFLLGKELEHSGILMLVVIPGVSTLRGIKKNVQHVSSLPICLLVDIMSCYLAITLNATGISLR